MPQTILFETPLLSIFTDGTTLFIRPKIGDVDFLRILTPDGVGLGLTVGFHAGDPYIPHVTAPNIDCGELKINGEVIASDQLTPISWDGQADTMDDAIRALIEHANLSRQAPPQ